MTTHNVFEDSENRLYSDGVTSIDGERIFVIMLNEDVKKSVVYPLDMGCAPMLIIGTIEQ